MSRISREKIISAAAPPHTFSEFFSLVISLTFWIVIFYTVLGIAAELMRSAGMPEGTSLESFLDSEAVALLSLTGTIDAYISAVVTGSLTPFWNRVLLSSLTVVIIILQSLVFGALFSFVFLSAERHFTRAKSGEGDDP